VLSERPPIRRATLLSVIATGRRMNRSANSAAIIAKALSQPNMRSEGRAENTVIARPQASTADVRISGGPTSTVARSTPLPGFFPFSDGCLAMSPGGFAPT